MIFYCWIVYFDIDLIACNCVVSTISCSFIHAFSFHFLSLDLVYIPFFKNTFLCHVFVIVLFMVTSVLFLLKRVK